MNVDLLIPYYGSTKGNIQNIESDASFAQKAFVAGTLGLTSAITTIGLSSIAGWNSVLVVNTISNPVTLPVIALATFTALSVAAQTELVEDFITPERDSTKSWWSALVSGMTEF